MKQIFLKFADEPQANSVLSDFTQIVGDEIIPIASFSIDTIGIICTPAVYNGEVEITPAIPQEGWHVNMLVPDETPESLVPYVVVPNTPRRIFAGWDW